MGDNWNRIGNRDRGLENTFNMSISIESANSRILYSTSQKGVFKALIMGKIG